MCRQRLKLLCFNMLVCSSTKVGALGEAAVRPSVCLSVSRRPVAQKRCFLELCLLYNTNRKPHGESRTHQSMWSYGYQKWSKKLTSLSSISRKPSEMRATAIIKREYWIGSLRLTITRRGRPEWSRRLTPTFKNFGFCIRYDTRRYDMVD